MPWVDLAVICIVVRGAIYGYFRGILRMFFKVLLLYFAVIVSNCYKGVLVAYLSKSTEVVEAVYRNISREIVLPVDVIQGSNILSTTERLIILAQNINIPAPYQNDLFYYLTQVKFPIIVEGYISEGEIIAMLLSSFMINVFTFMVSLVLISGMLYIISEIVLYRCNRPLLEYIDKLGGILLGGIRSYLIISMIVGVLTGLFFIQMPKLLIDELDKSLIIRYSMELFLNIDNWWQMGLEFPDIEGI